MAWITVSELVRQLEGTKKYATVKYHILHGNVEARKEEGSRDWLVNTDDPTVRLWLSDAEDQFRKNQQTMKAIRSQKERERQERDAELAALRETIEAQAAQIEALNARVADLEEENGKLSMLADFQAQRAQDLKQMHHELMLALTESATKSPLMKKAVKQARKDSANKSGSASETPEERAAFLKQFEDWKKATGKKTITEFAESLGQPRTTVGQKINRAKRDLEQVQGQE